MATNENCAEVRVGVTGHLYAAPVGTAMPADTTTPIAAAWVPLGYTTEDGLSMTVDMNKEDFRVWQSNQPCRSVITEQTYTSTFTLVQRNPATLAIAFGGGTISGTAPDHIYTPPPAGLYERAFLYEVVDGSIIDRWCMFRGTPALSGDIQFTKSEMTGYEIEVTHLGTTAGTWQLISNDPALTTMPVGFDVEEDEFSAATGVPAGDVPDVTTEEDEAGEPTGRRKAKASA
jgi:hypothetical protein